MIQEDHIIKIAILCAVIGLVALFIFLQTAEIETAGFEGLEEKADDTVYVEGTVLAVKEMEGVTFVMLERSETVNVMLFGPAPRVEIGDYVQIRGEVSLDEEGQAEMTGEEMRLIG